MAPSPDAGMVVLDLTVVYPTELSCLIGIAYRDARLPVIAGLNHRYPYFSRNIRAAVTSFFSFR